MILEKVKGCHLHSKAETNCRAGFINPIRAAQVSKHPTPFRNVKITPDEYKNYHHPKSCSSSSGKLFCAFALIMLASYTTKIAFIEEI